MDSESQAPLSETASATQLDLQTWIADVTTAVVFISALIAATPLPINAGALALRILLLTLPATVLASISALVTRRPWVTRVVFDKIGVGKIVALTVGVLSLGAALWATKFAVTSIFHSQRGTRVLGMFCGTAVVLAVVSGAVARRSLRLRRWGSIRVAQVATTVLAAAAYFVERTDRLIPFWPLRYSHTLIEVVLILVAAKLARRAGWLSRRASIFGAIILGVSVAIVLTMRPRAAQSAYVAVFRYGGGSERRVLHLLRSTLDLDGDGYSRFLGGGDCDDGNPRAYPLGPIDCEGIVTAAARPTDPKPPIQVAPVNRVLLITVDALRCDLNGERLCPGVDRIAESASYHGKQHVFMAQTLRSLGALFGAPFIRLRDVAQEQPSYLLTNARSNGYLTKAYYTLPLIELPAVINEFQDVEEIAPTRPGMSPFEDVTAGRLTDRVVADLRSATDSKRFSWVHYLDPHEFYISTAPGAPVPWFRFNRERDYMVEVRRTEGEVVRLIETARSMGYDKNAAIILTADHGESFLPGHVGHGTSSSSSELDVPLVIWILDNDGRVVPLRLPEDVYETDVASILAGLLGVAPPPGQARLSVTRFQPDVDEQFVVFDAGWKLVHHRQGRFDELFNVASDPQETADLAATNPRRLAEMRTKLGRELARALPALRIDSPER